ncbi:GRAM domain-containing protein 3 [Ophiophagus hannah]|uniref:GRAM domain-containing protein 3 n=1 Tax=Ophiophagus hannah TaxID=8665 RepID=V8NL03_OPHHA|nr:GRAM domain-containing protein 3 [Ophiophagus hannah]
MVLMIDLQPDGDELKPVRVASKKEKAALIHSENENGTEEKKKLGKPGFGVPQISFNEADCFDDQKKVAIARSKTIVDNSFLMLDGKNDSKAERKKHSSNQFKANAHFHKLFLDVPIDEPLRQNFTCALQKEIMYQGKLYVSENWICFHSKVFGKDIKITIPVLSVTLIKKTKTALLVPNALIITTVSDRKVVSELIVLQHYLWISVMISLNWMASYRDVERRWKSPAALDLKLRNWNTFKVSI